MKLTICLKGGAGSGFHGHKGRPGFVGGSSSEESSNSAGVKKVNITFKREPRNTGLYAVGHPYTGSDIKFNGKVVGKIHAPDYTTKDNKWSVGFMVKKTEIDSNPNVDWKWIFFKTRFDSDELAREFVNKNIGVVLEKYTLHQEE
jgi:hypothetical protein